MAAGQVQMCCAPMPTIGDFATTRVDGTFSLAYLVFNTINNLTTQAKCRG